MNLSPYPPGDGPECPECGAPVASGGLSVRTCAMGSSGYDDEGDYHSHDPNWSTATLTCENGHEFKEKTRRACPHPDCDFGGEVEIVPAE